MSRLVAHWRVVAVGVVVVAVVAWFLWLILPWAPSREQAEQDIVAVTAQDGVPGVRAVCDEPKSEGWTCRLRSASGYGRAFGSVRSEPGSEAKPLPPEYVYWSYDFPLDNRGVLSREVEVRAPYRIGDVLYRELGGALEAAGRDRQGVTVDCSGRSPGAMRNYAREALEAARGPLIGGTTRCTSSGGVSDVSFQRLTETRYYIRLTVDVPG